MSFPPPNATLSGVAPLVAPFTSPITFYAIPTPTSVLLYSFGQVSTLSNNKLATITAGDAASAVTVHFLLNYGGNYIDWFSQPASITDPVAIAAIQRTTIQIVQVTASSALTPSTSMTTAAGGPSVNGATIAPTVNSATITPSVTNTPISSATPKVSSPTSVQQSHGISSGAAAGVAIGCLIAGALIAGLVLWFCWGRRKAQRSRYSEAGAISLTPFEKGPLAHNMFLGSGSPAQLGAITGLPQPLEDQAISGEVLKISNLIKNHVQSYYHNRIMSPGIIGVNGVVELGEDLPFPTGTLSTLLDDITTREVALRFSIAWAIISRLQNYDDPSRTLLPHELCESLRNITKAEHGSKVHTSVIARWRVSTAELMQTAYVDNAFTASDSRNSSIQTLTYTLEKILQPFADPRMNNEQRKRNLEEILKRSASFAFTLFSQFSAWDFDWKKGGVETGDICIFPALVQITNEAGEPVRPPRYFSEAVIRKLGG